MKILALETSTNYASVALSENDTVLAEESSLKQKSHSEIISTFTQSCLDKSKTSLKDIDVFAVGIGPGSFTGIRVATNAGKTYAYCFSKPVVAIDSLTLVAEQARQHQDKPVLVILNAHKNMVYLGLFELSGAEPRYLQGPVAVPVRELSQHIKVNAYVLGDGWDAFHEYFPEDLKLRLEHLPEVTAYPQASTLAKLAYQRAKAGHTLDWNSFTPLYIRSSEAEETKKGIFITPLQ